MKLTITKIISLIFVGCLITSGWWATLLWGGVPIGPNGVPLVGIATVIATAFPIALLVWHVIMDWTNE